MSNCRPFPLMNEHIMGAYSVQGCRMMESQQNVASEGALEDEDKVELET